jgi:steroid delta-isomerase-like uncharacterized protein
MSLEENKAIVRRLAEAINEKDSTAMDDIIASDFVDPDRQLRGLDSYKKYESMFTKGFPDMHLTIKDIIAKDDKVWIRIEVTGTHTGEFRGISSTGKKIKLNSFMIWRIADGKIVERESQVWDFIDFFKQLGVIEFTEKAEKIFSN